MSLVPVVIKPVIVFQFHFFEDFAVPVENSYLKHGRHKKKRF